LLALVVLPNLVASNANTQSDIRFIGYEEVTTNQIFTKIAKNDTVKIADLAQDISRQVLPLDKKSIMARTNLSDLEQSLQNQIQITLKLPIAKIILKPPNPQLKEFLRYPEYNINAPLVYSKLSDFFESDDKGILKRDSKNQLIPIVENPADIAKGNYESVPIQRLLKNGVVHSAFTVEPGEIGNSYIVGHSSNFSTVQSAYNYIFKPIEKRSKVGEEFFIFDRDGRELRFRVFEVLEIQAEDVGAAYKNFGDKRVVTLQTSILDANFQPTKRWLTRGELVLP
jgi:sortase (surface protein transpeptidase)